MNTRQLLRIAETCERQNYRKKDSTMTKITIISKHNTQEYTNLRYHDLYSTVLEFLANDIKISVAHVTTIIPYCWTLIH